MNIGDYYVSRDIMHKLGLQPHKAERQSPLRFFKPAMVNHNFTSKERA
jgi:hypothetical protein